MFYLFHNSSWSDHGGVGGGDAVPWGGWQPHPASLYRGGQLSSVIFKTWESDFNTNMVPDKGQLFYILSKKRI